MSLPLPPVKDYVKYYVAVRCVRACVRVTHVYPTAYAFSIYYSNV